MLVGVKRTDGTPMRRRGCGISYTEKKITEKIA
jgi:hypothetical protein